MKVLEPIKPWFIEEPTAPDDAVGHATIRKAAPPSNGFGWREPTLMPCVSQPKPANGPLDRVVMVSLPW